MKIDDLVQFHNGIIQFDRSLPIAVTWSPENGLIYRQFGKVQAYPFMSNYYFPYPKLELGVLMPTDLEDLKSNLESLIQDPALNSNSLNSIIGKYEFKVYKLFNGLLGPQLTYRLKFVTFINKYISKYVLYRSGLTSKLLLKAINNESREKIRRGSQN